MTLALSIIGVFIIFLWGYLSSNLIIKMTRVPPDINPRTFGYEFESFKTLTEDDVEIDGWFVPAKSKTKSGATIVILHGWGANRSDMVASTIFLADHYNLAYFDFRNHGRSGGNETSLTCLEMKDYIAVVKFLKLQKKDFCANLGAYGFSLGGSVAITGSTKLPEIKALIAESPFSSFNGTVYRFAKIFYNIPAFVVPLTLIFTRIRLGFDPEDCAPIYHVHKLAPRPIFIIQGGSDERMPPSEGQALFNAAGEPKEFWLVPDADHGVTHENSTDEYKRRVLSFYQKWLKT